MSTAGNATGTVVLYPEVADFLDAVRGQLADLDVEEQREILDGLEADLSDLVAERGPEALGDPAAYAGELRAAAGLEPVRSVRRAGVGVRLDRCRDRTLAFLGQWPNSGPVLAWLRPFWWLSRAWIAVEFIALTMHWDQTFAWMLFVPAAAVSILIGLGKLWPGGARGTGTRVVLLGLNTLAVVLAPVVVVQWGDHVDNRYWDGYASGSREASMPTGPGGPVSGLRFDGEPVGNIYPYDAQGHPLAGVQLFDQEGKPLPVSGQPTCPNFDDPSAAEVSVHPGEIVEECTDYDGQKVPGRVFYPWTNGQAQLLNVFPVPSRMQVGTDPSATAFSESSPPTIGPLPMAEVPKVSSPAVPNQP